MIMTDTSEGVLLNTQYLLDVIVSHSRKLWNLFPETWTDYRNINMLALSYQLKLYGLEWTTDEQFSQLMVLLYQAGLVETQEQGRLIRRSHVFKLTVEELDKQLEHL